MESSRDRCRLILVIICLIVEATFCSSVYARNKETNLLSTSNHWSNNGTAQGYISLQTAPDSGAFQVQVETVKAAPWDYYPQISLPLTEGFRKGEFLRLALRARSADNLFLDIDIQHNAAPWESVASRTVVMRPDWQKYDLIFRVKDEVPAGWANLTLHIPRKIGRFEISDVSLESLGTKYRFKGAKTSEDNPYAGGELEPQWWHEAGNRIEQIRKRKLVIRVQDPQGKPIANAKISVNQVNHFFKFGTAISAPFIVDANSDARYRSFIIENFNSVVPENALKWGMQDYQSAATLPLLMNWCKQNNLNIRGHCLLWPSYGHLPEILRSVRGPLLSEAVKQHVVNYVKTFSPDIYEWDVVNEAVTNSELQKELGDRIIVDAFRWARQADEKVKLAYNDYDILNNRAGANDSKRAAVRGLISNLLEAGAPIDVLGIQSHMQFPVPRGSTIWSILDEWGRFGKPVAITEYDLATYDDKLQADYLSEFLTAAFSHPSVQSFYMWGFWEGAHHQAASGAALVHQNWQDRPAMDAYRELVYKKWWTRAQGATDETGAFATRAFFGKYEISIEPPDGRPVIKELIEVPAASDDLEISRIAR